MDLNKIYPVLPDEDQKSIDKIVLNYFGSFAKSMGYSLVENARALTVPSPKKPAAPPSKPRGPKPRLFPLQLHGLSIPSKERLVELYNHENGRWLKGKLTWTRINQLRYAQGMDWLDIFPNPPEQATRDTIIKRKDENGDSFTPL